VTSLPTWAVWTLSFGSPAITAAIAVLAQYFSHRDAGQLETRSEREEVMRILRWASELAVSEDRGKARLGIQELRALRDYKMLASSEEEFIDAALRAAIEVPLEAIARSGGEVEVIVTPDPDVVGESPVSSEEEGEGQEGADVLWRRGFLSPTLR
jgi:hypothetical protein